MGDQKGGFDVLEERALEQLVKQRQQDHIWRVALIAVPNRRKCRGGQVRGGRRGCAGRATVTFRQVKPGNRRASSNLVV
jgi:hypothetical protein